MKNCIFCKIISGAISSHMICEDNLFYSFLDVNPLTRGHVLVIPKKHVRWVYEVEKFERYWNYVHTITGAIQKSLKPKWVNFFTYGEIPHAHIHILPRYEDIQTNTPIIPSRKTFSEAELAAIAKKIRTVL